MPDDMRILKKLAKRAESQAICYTYSRYNIYDIGTYDYESTE
jgi:hypothetical protein